MNAFYGVIIVFAAEQGFWPGGTSQELFFISPFCYFQREATCDWALCYNDSIIQEGYLKIGIGPYPDHVPINVPLVRNPVKLILYYRLCCDATGRMLSENYISIHVYPAITDELIRIGSRLNIAVWDISSGLDRYLADTEMRYISIRHPSELAFRYCDILLISPQQDISVLFGQPYLEAQLRVGMMIIRYYEHEDMTTLPDYHVQGPGGIIYCHVPDGQWRDSAMKQLILRDSLERASMQLGTSRQYAHCR